MKCQKIMIFGRPGNGKSTMALKLHKATRLPLYHLDKYFFKDNWVERNYNDFLSILANFVTQPAWIIDGNNITSFEMRYSQANIVIYFNLPRLLCLYRIIKRLFFKNPEIDDRAENSPEKLSFTLLEYWWNFNNHLGDTLQYLNQKYPEVRFIEVNSDAQAKKVLDILAQQS